MGQAKARGTFEQRRELAIERIRVQTEAVEDARKAREEREAERIRSLPPQERREAVLVGGGTSRLQTRALMAALVASGSMAVPFLTLDEGTKRRYRK